MKGSITVLAVALLMIGCGESDIQRQARQFTPEGKAEQAKRDQIKSDCAREASEKVIYPGSPPFSNERANLALKLAQDCMSSRAY